MTNPHSDPPPVDRPDLPDVLDATGEAMRALLRRFPAPVVVVTINGERGARGATIGSFASLSLDPPRVCFSVMQGTKFHEVVADEARVAVHLLAEDQADLAERFALPGLDAEEQTEPFKRHKRPGLPILLAGSLGILLGTIDRRVDVGDHTLVVARVERLLKGREGVKPLLYLEQAYRGVGGVVRQR